MRNMLAAVFRFVRRNVIQSCFVSFWVRAAVTDGTVGNAASDATDVSMAGVSAADVPVANVSAAYPLLLFSRHYVGPTMDYRPQKREVDWLIGIGRNGYSSYLPQTK